MKPVLGKSIELSSKEEALFNEKLKKYEHHGISYAAKNAHDLSYKTAWVEGVQEDGIGEYLVYRFPPTNPHITKAIVINGYIKSGKTWGNNPPKMTHKTLRHFTVLFQT